MGAVAVSGRPEKDGSEEVIALARKVGLECIGPAPVADSEVASQPLAQDDGTDDTIALAQTVGISGFIGPEEADQESVMEVDADAAEVIKLAQSVGLAGIRQDVRVTVAVNSPVASNAGEPPSPAQPSNVNLAVGASDASPAYIQFQIVGTAGINERREWERQHGALSAIIDGKPIQLEQQCSGWTNVIFRAPADSATREFLRRAAPMIGSTYFRIRYVKKFERGSYRFAGPGAQALPAAYLRDREPPPLPDQVLAGLRKGRAS